MTLRMIATAAACVLAATLQACGGSDGTVTPPPPDPLAAAPEKVQMTWFGITNWHYQIGDKGVHLGMDFNEADMHIVCPWHGWEFHLKDGCHVIDPRHRLKKYDVVERGGEIYVAI